MTTEPQASGRRPDGAAFVVAVALAALGALLIWEGGRVPDKAGYSGVGPGDIPVFVGLCLVFLALWTAIAAFRETPVARPQQHLGPVFWIIAGLALQLVLLKPLGFSIASGILFACTAAAFGHRNLGLTLPIGIVFAFVVYGVFDRLLQLNLPAGIPETLIYGG